MVLQREHQLPVWGWGVTGQKVTVSFAGETRSTYVDENGEWMVKLTPVHASSEPRTLTVACHGCQTIRINDVLVGDVWLCSGQSNMEFPLESATNSQHELETACHPNLRFFTTANVTPTDPQTALPQGFSSWHSCTPETARSFSAVGYFFGRQLEMELNVPIGLIHSSWGGTPIESWMSVEALQRVSGFAREVDDLRTDIVQCHNEFHDDANAFVENWFGKNDPGSLGYKWAAPNFEDSKWPVMSLPKRWRDAGVDHAGVVWFRCAVDVPADWAGKDLTVSLGKIDFQDVTWFNGKRIGAQPVSWRNRLYRVPGELVKAGRNLIAVRVYCDRNEGGFNGSNQGMELTLEGNKKISLSNNWHYQTGGSVAQMGRKPWKVGVDPYVPATLYNGKIAPLTPFSLRGAVWYQGEGNTSEPEAYRGLLAALIGDWRERFACGDFPFGIVQLASFKERSSKPQTSGWATVREAQAQVAQTVTNCGLAVTIDIGDADDIHPKNKQEVGRRLALWALANIYGRSIEWSGPWFKGMEVEADRVRIYFDHPGGGLVAKGGVLKGFAIAGDDRKFYWADAFIDGNSVVASSMKVPKPVAVRYAWADNPDCNLYNAAGLPAVPFRTDDWPSNLSLGD